MHSVGAHLIEGDAHALSVACKRLAELIGIERSTAKTCKHEVRRTVCTRPSPWSSAESDTAPASWAEIGLSPGFRGRLFPAIDRAPNVQFVSGEIHVGSFQAQGFAGSYARQRQRHEERLVSDRHEAEQLDELRFGQHRLLRFRHAACARDFLSSGLLRAASISSSVEPRCREASRCGCSPTCLCLAGAGPGKGPGGREVSWFDVLHVDQAPDRIVGGGTRRKPQQVATIAPMSPDPRTTFSRSMSLPLRKSFGLCPHPLPSRRRGGTSATCPGTSAPLHLASLCSYPAL